MSHEFNDQSGGIIKQQRTNIPLTLYELAARAGISASHLGRIERGERFPSAHTLRKIAPVLGFEESDLFTMAGYLSSPYSIAENDMSYSNQRLDPYVAKLLGQEPVEVQRAVVSILNVLKGVVGSDITDAFKK